MLHLRLLFGSYYERLKLGEGGLVGFAFLLALYQNYPLSKLGAVTLLALLVLSALYAFNDYVDRYSDKLNPKKNIELSDLLIENRKLFLTSHLVLCFITVLATTILLSFTNACLLVLTYIINMIYSFRAKSLPFLDIFAVFAWGGLYIAFVAGIQWMPILFAAVMTSIAHVFQTMADKDSDRQNEINTSAVILSEKISWILCLICGVLSIISYLFLGMVPAILAWLPYASIILLGKVNLSWYLSRIVFVIIWIVLLENTYGSICSSSVG